jgi:L-asparaginase
VTGAVRPAIAPEDLVRVAALERDLEVEVIEVDRVNGWNVTPDTMLTVVARLDERLADPCVAGAIVTHGTDTVEETAFLAELLVDRAKPVVFAAAMRTGVEVGADGPRNLANAARVAGSAAAAGWGALVVMNDEVHCARWCVKTDSFRPSAFASPGHGPVGFVTPERVRIMPAPARFVLQPPRRLDAAVPVVTTYSGMPPTAITSVLEATGALGLVVQGTGAGNVPGSIAPALREAVDAGMVVSIATRVLTGGTVPIYGGPGGGVTLRDAGVVSAGALTAAKARLLLMVALADGTGPARAAQLFRAGVEELAPGAFGTA